MNNKPKIRTTTDQEQEKDLIRTTNLKSKQKQQINNKEADLTQSRLHALGSWRKTSSGEEAAVDRDFSYLLCVSIMKPKRQGRKEKSIV